MFRLSALIVCLKLVNTECPVETIERIRDFWGDEPPKNVLKSNVGMVTYVWMSGGFIKDKLNDDLYCFATNLDRDETSSTDILMFTNRSAEEVSYFQTEDNGVITLYSHGEADDTQYIISQKNNVTAFWQCKVSNIDKYEPYVGISVKVSDLHSHTAEEAVIEAIDTLANLGFKTGTALPPCQREDFKIFL
ncbi:uncharacterized protein LOC129003354 [Macrosteles quadrilineatus]|uniref:uncharacterized protein LOC129003354 n=1 Tax=Macrosteles quadrilineatus TaxID=74068 RepID=UPI0023E1A74B|nr:uncharacterized protein LOC129003354 [Macrosteles quadrilineatus]